MSIIQHGKNWRVLHLLGISWSRARVHRRKDFSTLSQVLSQAPLSASPIDTTLVVVAGTTTAWNWTSSTCCCTSVARSWCLQLAHHLGASRNTRWASTAPAAGVGRRRPRLARTLLVCGCGRHRPPRSGAPPPWVVPASSVSSAPRARPPSWCDGKSERATAFIALVHERPGPIRYHLIPGMTLPTARRRGR